MAENRLKRFGRYEILAELGRGAMGIVYKARDPQIGRLVALKTISLRGQGPEEEQEFRTLFRREAQAAGRLQHPGLVAIYDAGEDEENHDPYIVLEFVSSESLNRVLSREKKLPLARALTLAGEIADALDYAHAQGVVHRDIKPGNILLTDDGRAKIADFGIAQLNLAHFTLPGRVLGTPAYMAPEQLSGESVDGRSDIFSLGVLLYTMATGHSPFPGNSATTVCYKVVHREPVAASALDLDLPRGLDAVISRAMAKDPAQRYQRASQFAKDLRALGQPSESALLALSVSPATGTGSNTVVNPVRRTKEAGFVHAEELVRFAIQRASAKNLVVAGALVGLLILVAIPTRQAVMSQNAAAQMDAIIREHSAAATQSPANSAATPAKPRDSIVAEMEGPDTEASSAGAAPAHTAASSSPHAQPLHRPMHSPNLKSGMAKTPAKLASVSATTTAKTQLTTKLDPATKPATAVQSAPAATSTLELAVEHHFKDATLSVWIDDRLALTRELHGGNEKKFLFNGVHGVESESLQLAAGTHQLRIRAESGDQSIDLSRTISANFSSGDDRTLKVSFDKHSASMHLAWQ